MKNIKDRLIEMVKEGRQEEIMEMLASLKEELDLMIESGMTEIQVLTPLDEEETNDGLRIISDTPKKILN